MLLVNIRSVGSRKPTEHLRSSLLVVGSQGVVVHPCLAWSRSPQLSRSEWCPWGPCSTSLIPKVMAASSPTLRPPLRSGSCRDSADRRSFVALRFVGSPGITEGLRVWDGEREGRGKEGMRGEPGWEWPAVPQSLSPGCGAAGVAHGEHLLSTDCMPGMALSVSMAGGTGGVQRSLLSRNFRSGPRD